MASSRKVVAMMAVMSLFPCADFVTYASAATPEQRAQLARRESGSQSLEQARRFIAGLGGRRQVAVTLTSGATLHGQVREVAADHFLLVIGRAASGTPIAYSAVQQIGSDSGRTKKIWLGVALAAGVAIARS
jgi:hypothetical protein